MVSRDEILQILRAHREELEREFHVSTIALFGSAARGDAGPFSDVDILVDLSEPISLFRLVALRFRLEEILNVPKVDVVQRDAIIPALRERILSEAVRVA